MLITGKIYDERTAQPVFNMVVTVLNPDGSPLGLLATTTREGLFSLGSSKITAANTVVISHPEYGNIEMDIPATGNFGQLVFPKLSDIQPKSPLPAEAADTGNKYWLLWLLLAGAAALLLFKKKKRK